MEERTKEKWADSICYVVVLSLIALAIIVPRYDLLPTNTNPTDTYTTGEIREKVTARVLTKDEVDNFNLGNAVVGYVFGHSVNKSGGLLGGISGGIVASGPCQIPLMIENKPQILSLPNKACRELKENDTKLIWKITTWGGQINYYW